MKKSRRVVFLATLLVGGVAAAMFVTGKFILGNVADGPTAKALEFGNTVPLANATSKIAAFYPGSPATATEEYTFFANGYANLNGGVSTNTNWQTVNGASFLYSYNSIRGPSVQLTNFAAYSEADLLTNGVGTLISRLYAHGFTSFHGALGDVLDHQNAIGLQDSVGAGAATNNHSTVFIFKPAMGAGATITNETGVYVQGPMNEGTATNRPFFYDSGAASFWVDAAGSFRAQAPLVVDTVFANAALVAGTTIGGGIWPAQATTLRAIRFRVSVAGAGGTTNATIRASDGASNCDFSFACNTATGNKRIAATGSCVFAASASITYTVPTIGNCASGPTAQGNINVEGWLQ